jgi:hypothetical protein
LKGNHFMNSFNWSKAIGYGVVTWTIMIISLWILGSFNSVDALWAHGIVAVIGGVTAYLLGRNARPETLNQALGYGFTWALMGLTLDLVVTQWFDAHIFGAWQQWMSYALVMAAPLLQIEAHRHVSQSA